MGFYTMLCNLHATQWQEQGTIVFYCAHPIPCPCPGPGPVQYVWPIKWNFILLWYAGGGGWGEDGETESVNTEKRNAVIRKTAEYRKVTI